MASNTKKVAINCGLSALQLHLYQSIIRRDLEIINNETWVNNGTLLGTVMQLKQCCCHPYLFKGMEQEQAMKQKSESLDPESITTHHLLKNCGKLFVIDKLITNIKSNQIHQQILLCSQIKEMFEWFEAYCNLRGISFYTMSHQNNSKINPFHTKCDIIIHHTSNQDTFNEAIQSFANINTVIFYDTDWSIKDKEEDIIKTLQEECKEKEGLNVYTMITKDTLEEKLFKMEQNDELNTEELLSLIKYKAVTILNITNKSTLNTEQNIDDILNDTVISDDNDINDDDLKVEPQRKYTLKDIINHPENQGVIRVFIGFFIAMIVIPVIIVIGLNKYVMKHYLLDWSNEGKQNLTLVIGVAIAHIIGLIYVCYSWSGEDKVPAHILDDDDDDDEEDEEEEEEEEEKQNGDRQDDENNNNKDIDDKISPKSDDSSKDKREYMFVERTECRSTSKDIIDDKGGQNVLRKRKRNQSTKDND